MTENYYKDIARYRMTKAMEILTEARQTYMIGTYRVSVTLSYYCILTAMRSLLAVKSRDSKSHEGVITLFHKLYVKTGLFPKEFNKIIKEMKNLREEADYGDFVEITNAEAAEKIEYAEAFLKKAEEVLIKVLMNKNDNNISKSRKEFK